MEVVHLVITLNDVTAEVLQQQKLAAIHKAGSKLADLKPDEIFEMGVDQRIELLKDNPEWATAARREDLNHFMTRLIFCFFAKDTAIFHGDRLFTGTIEQMTARAIPPTPTWCSPSCSAR